MIRVLVLVIVAMTVAPAAADSEPCREFEDPRPVCRNWVNYFVPTATGVAFAPNQGDSLIGGGLEFALLSWSRNRDTFGPSQGVLLFHVALLDGESADGLGSLAEGGAMLSFERSASRAWLIPFYGLTLGRISGAGHPTAWFAQPAVGAHLLWTRTVSIDLRGGYHVPFSKVDRLRGPRGQLSVRVTLW